MEPRHVLFGAVFVIVFGVGMANVSTNGDLVHEISTELPIYEASGNASIQQVQKATLQPGESKQITAKIQNVREVSYTDPNVLRNVTSNLEFDVNLSPPPAMVQESLPPSYIYDQATNTVTARINISATGNAEPGNYTFELQARKNSSSDYLTREIPVEIKN